jgi:hypothetical protein
LKLPVFAAFGIFLFAAFKGGFVRHDGHALYAAAALLVAMPALGLWASPRATTSAIFGLVMAAWLMISHSYIQSWPDLLYGHAARFYTDGIAGLAEKLAGTRDLNREYQRALADIRQEVRIPLVKGTTDIYRHNQAFLLASGNQWQPRPVLQSYTAYTSRLAQIDRSHLESNEAAANIFMRIETIDHRLPALADGSSWPVLLARYRPSAFEG